MGSASSCPPCFAGLAWHKGPTCVVLLRHGQREDYVAHVRGQGADWVATSPRPWDPHLAPEGFTQATSAAERMRTELRKLDLPTPSRIYTSPLVRCVETAGVVANHFGVSSLLVEDGLVETIGEGWFRQWAVPGANSTWGGPPGACMANPVSVSVGIEGPPVRDGLRVEAEMGLKALLLTAPELAELPDVFCAKMVAARHVSVVSIREQGYCWGNFETRPEVASRAAQTVNTRAAQHPGRTIVFVTHGNPAPIGYTALTGESVPEGSGGMTALSILRRAQGSTGHWEPLMKNDATHAKTAHCS